MNQDFFSSDENLVGASTDNPFYLFEDCLGVTGLGEGKNRTALASTNGNLILEANNENLIWMDACIHRFRSKQGYGPLSLHRLSKLQDQVRQMLLLSKPKKYIEGESLFLGHAFGWHAFGHLHDTLQRVYFCSDFSNLSDLKFIVNRYDRIVNFEDHLSAVVGCPVKKENILVIDNSHDYIFEKIYYSHSPAVMTSYTIDSLAWIQNAYKDKFGDGGSYPEILYLSRNAVRPGFRSIDNENDIINFISTYNSEVVYGTEPLEYIINLFINAKKIFGTHGSLLANVFICNENCDILELCPKSRIDNTQKNKLKLAKYTQMIVESDKNHNIEVDIDLIDKFICFDTGKL